MWSQTKRKLKALGMAGTFLAPLYVWCILRFRRSILVAGHLIEREGAHVQDLPAFRH